MKYKLKRKNKTVKAWHILLILIIIIILMSTSYSLWQTNLYINGTVIFNYIEPVLQIEVVEQENGRLSTNTSFTSVGILYRVFDVAGDEYEGNNTVVTKLVNANKVLWIGTYNKDVTFTFSMNNNSEKLYTEGQIQIEEYDPDGRMNPTNASLSNTTLKSGNSVTLTTEITFDAKNDITVGSYINYKISFWCDGVKEYFNYKILISG